jgi:hypothetical protein
LGRLKLPENDKTERDKDRRKAWKNNIAPSLFRIMTGRDKDRNKEGKKHSPVTFQDHDRQSQGQEQGMEKNIVSSFFRTLKIWVELKQL